METRINGRTPTEIERSMENCIGGGDFCNECPFSTHDRCRTELETAALDYIYYLKDGEWDVFSLLSMAWHGKSTYFRQENGTVYSRISCKYLTFDQALREFATTLASTQEVENDG